MLSGESWKHPSWHSMNEARFSIGAMMGNPIEQANKVDLDSLDTILYMSYVANPEVVPCSDLAWIPPLNPLALFQPHDHHQLPT